MKEAAKKRAEPLENELRRELTERVLQRLDLKQEVAEEVISALIDAELQQEGRHRYLGVFQKQQLKRDIFNSLRGFDVLQELLEDASVTEIMINGVTDIFVEREGKLLRTERQFASRAKLEDIIQQIAAGANRIINEASPIVDARLADGSRVNMVLPPVALDGPVVTIRKFSREAITMERLLALGSITEEAVGLLRLLVMAGYNLFVSGGTGSGKTTFLNALTAFIPQSARIITIEDSAELQIRTVPNLVRMEVRNANTAGENAIGVRELIKTAMRMRPDWIIIGEVRDAACVDMLQALNTGHSGMSTGHANSARELISRLETMVILGAELPLVAVRRQIATALECICHLGRLRDKSRRVLEISEVLTGENGEVLVSPLFVFRETGQTADGHVIGKLCRTEQALRQTEKLAAAGLRWEEA